MLKETFYLKLNIKVKIEKFLVQESAKNCFLLYIIASFWSILWLRRRVLKIGIWALWPTRCNTERRSKFLLFFRKMERNYRPSGQHKNGLENGLDEWRSVVRKEVDQSPIHNHNTAAWKEQRQNNNSSLNHKQNSWKKTRTTARALCIRKAEKAESFSFLFSAHKKGRKKERKRGKANFASRGLDGVKRGRAGAFSSVFSPAVTAAPSFSSFFSHNHFLHYHITNFPPQRIMLVLSFMYTSSFRTHTFSSLCQHQLDVLFLRITSILHIFPAPSSSSSLLTKSVKKLLRGDENYFFAKNKIFAS